MLYRKLDPGRALQALHHPSFRWFLVERMVGAETWAMRVVARGWLVYGLTGSVLALASVDAVRSAVGVLFSPVAGVISDRFEKRRVMVICRILWALVNLALAALIVLGGVQMWHIIVFSLVEGIIVTVFDPALTMIVPELVERETLLSATSAMFVTEGVLNIIGAAAAGVAIALVGVGGVFFLNALLYVLAAYSLTRIPRRPVARHERSVRSDLGAGVRYLRASPVLIGLIALAFVRVVFMQPYGSFLAAFSSDNLGFDAAGLGLLTSTAGLGALASSLFIAALGDPKGKGKLLLGCGAAAAAAAILLMTTYAIVSPFLLVILIGVFSNAAEVFTRTSMQETCEPGYRGRVFSVAMVLSHLVALSVIPAGVLADAYGVPLIVGSLAVLALAAHVAAAALSPSIRRLR